MVGVMKMNGEGQRPPNNEPQAQAHDAAEPGNARYPQHGAPNGQQPQEGEGGGGRPRFGRQRRGGRGRGRNKGQHHQNVQAPLDAQGRILDVENEVLPDDGAAEAVPPPGEPQAMAAAGEPQGSQSGADIPGGPSAPPPASAEAQLQGQLQAQGVQPARPPQQGQPRQQQPRPQPRQEPPVPIEGVLDVDHRGNGRLRSAKLNFLPQPDDPDVPRHMIDRDRLREGSLITGQAVRRNG